MPGQEVLIDQIKIQVAGTALTTEQAGKVSKLTLDSSLHLPDMFIIELSEIDADFLDNGPFAVGKAVEIGLANEQGTVTPIFKNGEITAIEPSFDENVIGLVVRGYDKAHRLHRGTKTKVFKNVMDSDIATTIAGDAGLTTDIDSTSVVYEHVFQDALSDFDFLLKRAERIGYTVLTNQGKLTFKKQTSPSSADITLELRKELIAFKPRMTLSQQFDTVNVKGWDVKKKDVITGTASSSSVNSETAQGQSGGATAQSALGGSSTHTSIGQFVSTQDDATKMAQGILDSANAAFITADGQANGVPTLHAGMVVEIKGIGTTYSGKYRATTVRHEYGKGNYDTYFTVEGARPDLLSYVLETTRNDNRINGVVTAIVTNNNNSTDDYGYVKLKYPWLDDQAESNWARVAFPGAGAQRGVYFMPEINDEVLVAFEQGDINRPFVIGGLYNGKDAPSDTISNIVAESKVKKRIIKTRTGHTLTFLDNSNGEEYIEIKDAKGNTQIKFDTANKKITMQSEGEIEISAKGNLTLKSEQDISIQTASGNVKVGGQTFSAKGTSSVEMKSDSGSATVQGMMFSIKGSGEGEVDGGGMLNVKGGLVKIN